MKAKRVSKTGMQKLGWHLTSMSKYQYSLFHWMGGGSSERMRENKRIYSFL